MSQCVGYALSLSSPPSPPLPTSVLNPSVQPTTCVLCTFGTVVIFPSTLKFVCARYFSLTKLGHGAHSWVLRHRIWLFGWLRACGTITVPLLSQNLYNHVCGGLHRLVHVVFCLLVSVDGKKLALLNIERQKGPSVVVKAPVVRSLRRPVKNFIQKACSYTHIRTYVCGQ